ncbi:isatin hydrolase-like [Centruroides vittatus]|uniref:isatin hydrolase-like n=1 Tax=Centruroides vittatus TaxID=120091 RepID=UPI00350EAE67
MENYRSKLIILWLFMFIIKRTTCDEHGKIVFVDLSHTITRNIPVFPDLAKFRIKIADNNLNNSLYKTENIYTTTHIGTHVDAPSHLYPSGWNISNIPLQRFIAPAVVVDIRHKTYSNPRAKLTPQDLIEWEKENGEILPGSILLILTGWDRYWNDEAKYISANIDYSEFFFPSVSEEAARWIIRNRDVYGVGIDTISFDRKPNLMVHRIFLGHSLYLIENLTNLHHIPKTGCTLYVMPIKIKGASGAPARILAAFIK